MTSDLGICASIWGPVLPTLLSRHIRCVKGLSGGFSSVPTRLWCHVRCWHCTQWNHNCTVWGFTQNPPTPPLSKFFQPELIIVLAHVVNGFKRSFGKQHQTERQIAQSKAFFVLVFIFRFWKQVYPWVTSIKRFKQQFKIEGGGGKSF